MTGGLGFRRDGSFAGGPIAPGFGLARRLGALAVALAVMGGLVVSGSAAAAVDRPGQATVDLAATPEAEPARILGFRSAHFGMTEAQVRQAIAADFKSAARDVAWLRNETERTNALSLEVDALLPVGGKARVSYILGFRSQTLIQVNIAWELGPGKAPSAEALIGAAGTLRRHFQTKAYKPNSVIVNAQLPDGPIVVFRGGDTEGRLTLLVLNGETSRSKGKDTLMISKPTSLLLSYIKDVDHPDIFRTKGDTRP